VKIITKTGEDPVLGRNLAGGAAQGALAQNRASIVNAKNASQGTSVSWPPLP